MKNFRGIYGILVAPFSKDYELDEEDIKSQVDFCIKGGVHGIVVPVNASEFFLLTDEEHNRFVRIATERAAGQIPVIAGVTAASTFQAVQFAKKAKEYHADGVITMPPHIMKATPNEIIEHYKAIAGACELPVFIQNYVEPMGSKMSAALCVDIIRKVDNVCYVKEETNLSGHVITEINELAKSLDDRRYKGTMGGKACRYLIDEYRRGSCGCMPACEIADVEAMIWDYLEAGENNKAQELFKKAMPLMNIEYMYGHTLYKEVLRRRGVIKTSITRTPGEYGLDAFDHTELDRIMKDLEPSFRV